MKMKPMGDQILIKESEDVSGAVQNQTEGSEENQ